MLFRQQNTQENKRELLIFVTPRNYVEDMKTWRNNIFLIGPMGAGKTSVGRYLAKQLNKDFYDSDQEIEKKTGVSLTWIYDLEGLAGFRQREMKTIDGLSALENIVLSTGGGPSKCLKC